MASLFTSYSNSQQIDTTGNLTNFTNQATGTTSTWQNAGTIGQQLTCWAEGDSGYCGPLPRVAAWGPGSNVINFSYGLTDLYQVVNIKNALPNSGTGLQVNGFNFSFQAKNGNGWDNGMTDVLSAYVSIYNNTNSKVLENYNWDLSYNTQGWRNFNYGKTFTSPYGVPDLGNAQYGFVGKDNNFWVGPYGPEIINVDFSLKYSVDPCATNPLYSPSCKGYMDALAKLAPAPVSVADAPPPPPPEDGAPPPPPGNPPPPGGSQQAGPPPPPGSPPQAGTSPAPSATAKSNDGGGKAAPSLGSVLSMISANQARIGNEAKSVVQAAESAAAKDAQQAQAQAESVAIALTEQSIASSLTTTSTSGSGLPSASSGSQSQTSSVALLTATQTTVGKVDILKQPTQPDLTESVVALTAPMAVNYSLQTNNTVSTATGLDNNYNSESLKFDLFLLRGPTAVTEAEMPQLEGIKIGTRSALMDAIEQQQPVQQTTAQTQQTSLVNRNVQSNELAGGVDISKMSTQPAGYQAYSFALADAPFYAPKEIYRNQVNVDNVRLLRVLGSDRLHQQLIDMQYK